MSKLTDKLKALKACSAGIEWVQDRTPQQMWEECERGDWLLWLAVKLHVDRKLIVLAACKCARESLQYVADGEDRPRRAIETAETWCRGDANIEEVRRAANAANAAYATADADAAAYAAEAAAVAVAAAANAADAADAAFAAAYAAYAAAAAYDAAAYDAAAYAAAANAANAADAAFAAANAAYATAAADAAAARLRSLRKSASYVRDIIPFEIIEQRMNEEQGE